MRNDIALDVVLADAARDAIVELAAASSDGRETGGILLGRGSDEVGRIEVLQAGDPGPDAKREPDFFLRDLAHARRLAAQAWERERAQWVGEWHTHPTSGPQPSQRDLATYASLLANPALKFYAFVSVIVTPDAEYGWGSPMLTTWLFVRC